MKDKMVPAAIWLVFEVIAISLWLAKNNIFYLYNFTYIGTALAVGLYLMVNGKPGSRRFVQLAVGSYMLIYLGLIARENMQLEGFWYYLFKGLFEAATIHYLIAKILGPLLFGRGWCGYACWHGMIFDLLPYKKPSHIRKGIGWLRMIMFIGSFVLVVGLIYYYGFAIDLIMFYLFIVSNILYYSIGIIIAYIFKDNRAFCKYVCPVTVFLKPMSYFSLLRVHCDEKACIHCGRCLDVCPMDVQVNCESRKRKYATECILCYECTKVCPVKALR